MKHGAWWLVMAALWGAPAAAQPRAGGAGAWVQARHAAVSRLLHTPPGDARNAQVARILNGMIDVDELSRRALDPYWAQRTPAEQQEFVGLLRQLIERNYRQNLDNTVDWTVAWEPEQLDAAAGTAMVRSTARSRTDARAAPVTIEYRLRRRDNDWIVYDLITNNASLVQTYHDSYTRIVREHGFPDLIRRMRARVDALGRPGDAGVNAHP